MIPNIVGKKENSREEMLESVQLDMRINIYPTSRHRMDVIGLCVSHLSNTWSNNILSIV